MNNCLTPYFDLRAVGSGERATGETTEQSFGKHAIGLMAEAIEELAGRLSGRLELSALYIFLIRLYNVCGLMLWFRAALWVGTFAWTSTT